MRIRMNYYTVPDPRKKSNINFFPKIQVFSEKTNLYQKLERKFLINSKRKL